VATVLSSRTPLRLLAVGMLFVSAACGTQADPGEKVAPPPQTVAGTYDASISITPPSESSTPTSDAATEVPSQEADPTPTAVSSTDTTISAMVASVLDKGDLLVRWEGRDELSVHVYGTPTQVDTELLQATFAQLGAVPGSPMMRLSNVADADVEIYFVEKARWNSIIDSQRDLQHDASGWAQLTWTSDGRISSAKILLDSTESQVTRNRAIVHEIQHGYGFGHHSCPGGSMYGESDYDPSWVLNRYDLELFAMHNNRNVPTGASSTELGALGTGVERCPPVLWDVVRASADTDVMWCARTTAGTHPCFVPDPRRVPELTDTPKSWMMGGSLYKYNPQQYVQFKFQGKSLLCATIPPGESYGVCQATDSNAITKVEFWHDGSIVYDYDPRTHIVFMYQNRRLLCEKPSGPATRAPCQFGDGAVVSTPELYTDGKAVFQQR
jgi:hypothetical protein